MEGWTLAFLILATIAALIGFGGLAPTAASSARLLFLVFAALFVIALLGSIVRRIFTSKPRIPRGA